MANGFSTKNTHTAAHPHAHPPARDRYVYTINNIYMLCARERTVCVCMCAAFECARACEATGSGNGCDGGSRRTTTGNIDGGSGSTV